LTEEVDIYSRRHSGENPNLNCCERSIQVL